MKPDRIPPPVWFVALTICAMFGIQRIGFYADDYVFLDAARRMPLGDVLLGQYGVYPWYRPLARELYFLAAVAFGDAGRAATLSTSLITAGALAWALFRVGESLGNRVAGAFGATLLLGHNLTRFLTAWASGYQDLLSACLVVWAVLMQLRGRTRTALLFAALAPFAKETGVIVFPMLYLAERQRASKAPESRFVASLGGTALVVLLLHLLVRMTWHGRGSSLVIQSSPGGLWTAVSDAARWFIDFPAAWTPGAILVAGLAILAFWGFTSRTPRTRMPGDSPRPKHWLLPLAGTLLGLVPLIVGNLLKLSSAKGYYAFPAIPWMGLLLGIALAAAPWVWARMACAGVLFLNLVAFSGPAPDLRTSSAWIPATPNWWEAVRLSTVTARFRADLPDAAAGIAPDGIILYTGIPTGSFFMQSADGTTTREMLRMPAVRAWPITEAPEQLDYSKVRIVAFNGRARHLEGLPRDWNLVSTAGMQRLLMGDSRSSSIFFRYAAPGSPTEKRFGIYLQTCAAIARFGPRALSASILAPWADSSDTGHTLRMAELLVPEPIVGLREAQHDVLASPLSLARRLALADSLLAHNAPLRAGIEARVAAALAPPDSRCFYLLGVSQLVSGAGALARPDLEQAVRVGSPPEYAQRARVTLESLRGSSAGSQAEAQGPS